MKKLSGAVAALLLAMGAAQAQSISVEDLRAQVDARVGEMNGYQELLSDPNPARAIAAMEIMMGSGDATLQRMAVEFGIFSTNPSVRAAALKAYLDAKPTLSVFLTLSDDMSNSERGWLERTIASLNGTRVDAQEAFLSFRVGDFDSVQDCYTHAVDSSTCLVRVSEQVVSFALFGRWNALNLDDAGTLVGTGAPNSGYQPVAMRIPITF